MKNITKKMGAFLTGAALTCAVLLTAALPARAKSLTEFQIDKLNSNYVAQRVSSNTSESMLIQYVGTSTEAVVTITTTGITAYAPAGTADTSFGTASGTYTLNASAYDTFGELCDAIDALASYECALLGGKRSDDSRKLRDQTAASGTNDLKATGGARFKFDTGAAAEAGTDVYEIRLGITPGPGGSEVGGGGSGRSVVLKTCTGNANVIGNIKIFGKLRKHQGATDGITRDDTTEVWSAVTADDTDLQVPLDIPEEGWLYFAEDAHVVISAGNGTSVQASANMLECQWEER